MADNLTAEVSGCYVIEDKGYDSNAHRAYLLSNNNIPVIPGRKNRKEPILYEKVSINLECVLKTSLQESRKIDD